MIAPTPIFELPYAEGAIPMMVGRASIVLEREDYDIDQGWLPFMDGVIWQYYPPTKPPETRGLRMNDFKAWARVEPEARRMYPYDRGVPQYVLPFHEFRRMSAKEHSRVEQAQYPAWDRTEKGEPLIITFKPDQKTEVESWCEINCTGRWNIKRERVFFERMNDAVMAKIFWQRST